MNSVKLDYKKEYKEFYLPPQKPVLVDLPPMQYIMVNGQGTPGGRDYQEAMSVLYSLSYTIKMSKMKNQQPEGYREYTMFPLEGFWWSPDGMLDMQRPKSEWLWTSAIRQPEFVTAEIFNWALQECREKKPEIPVERARLETLKEGLCVQIMHIGPYDNEQVSMNRLYQFIADQQLCNLTGDIHKHHEIYLSNPQRAKLENLKTVIRLPVRHK